MVKASLDVIDEFLSKEELKRPKEKVIFDGRNQYNAFDLPSKGFEYIQIGV